MQLLPFVFRGSPGIPEMDFAGTIVEMGSNVPEERGFAPGIPVFGSIPLPQNVKSTSGALAEYVVVDHTAAVKKPASLTLSEASGLGIAGVTALELVRVAKLKRGDSVLVNGASGGIGHFVTQMCQTEVGPSGKVVAVCSSKHVDWLNQLCTGSDRNVQLSKAAFEIVDYSAHTPVTSYLAETFGTSRFDAVLDAVGIQDMFNDSPGFLKDNKPFASVGPRAFSWTVPGMLSAIWRMAKNVLWPKVLGGTPRPHIQISVAANHESLEKLAQIANEGKLKVYVGALVPMKEVQAVSTRSHTKIRKTIGSHEGQAYEHITSGHAQGKIVVEMHGTNEE